MKTGALRERIEIQRQGAATDDGYTTQPGALETLFKLWADWQPIAGSEVFENLGREAKSGGYFFIRQSQQAEVITATDKVLWRGQVYDIIANDFHSVEKRRLTVKSDDEG